MEISTRFEHMINSRKLQIIYAMKIQVLGLIDYVNNGLK